MTFRRFTVLGVRALALAAVAAAVLRLPFPRASPPLLQCFVLDVSGSLFWGRQSDGAQMLELLRREAGRRRPDDRLALVAFAGRPALLVSPVPPGEFIAALDRELAPLLAGDAQAEARRRGLPPESSDPGAALNLSLALKSGGLPLHVLLMTDGAATRGDAGPVLSRLRQKGVPFAIVPVGPLHPPEIRLEAVHAPDRVPPGVAFDAAADIASSVSARLRVEIRRAGRPVAARDVAVGEGTSTRVTLSGLIMPSDAEAWEAVLIPPPDLDLCAENNRMPFEVAREAPGRRRVLVIGRTETSVLERLISGNPRHHVIRGAAPGEADACDLVLLDDVTWDEVPADVRAWLPPAVTHRGMGLLVAGGPRGLAGGSYAGCPLETLLPVWASPDERLGLVVAMDYSGSMARSAGGGATRIDRAREAVRRVLDLLRPEDRLAVIAFNQGADTVFPAAPPPAPAEFAARLRAIVPGGQTRLGPPLALSTRELAAAETGSRHVLMVTDAETHEPLPELEAVGRQLRDAGITLTLVITGQTPNVKALNVLMTDGPGGRRVALDDWNHLESVVADDIRRRKEWVVQGPLELQLATDSPLLSGLPLPPPLGAVNRTTPRPEGQVPIQGPRGLPVLAFRRAGAGRTAVLATSLDDAGWGAAWSGWSPHLTTLIDRLSDHLSEGVIPEVDVDAEDDGDRLRLTAIWREPASDSLPPALTARVLRPDGIEETVSLGRIDNRYYEGVWDAGDPGRYAVRVETGIDDGVRIVGSRVVHRPYAEEWRRLGRDRLRLEAMAREGGGRLVDTLAGLTDMRPSGPGLGEGFAIYAAAALALLLADLLIATFWRDKPVSPVA